MVIKNHKPCWLEWAQKLDGLAQAGLTYSTNPFDLERYHKIREVTAEILAEYTATDLPVMKNLLDAQAGYTTPKLDVRGAVFRDGKILLVKELSDGGWTLPGGWVDVNDSPSHAVEREVWEESGYEVKAVKMLMVHDRNQHGYPAYPFHVYKLTLRCEITGGAPTTSIETGGAEWFTEDALPTLSLTRTTPEALHFCFLHLRQPERPTDFD
jgi:ADP-ribose pyrophosphatase YjhB (NUDIX family)